MVVVCTVGTVVGMVVECMVVMEEAYMEVRNTQFILSRTDFI